MVYCNKRSLRLGISVIVQDLRLPSSWTFLIVRYVEIGERNENKYYAKTFMYYLVLSFLLILRPQVVSKVEELNVCKHKYTCGV